MLLYAAFAGHVVLTGQGVEREVAVLFGDLRAVTRMSEGRLPDDVVFVLNQYKAMGEALEAQGGRVDKFIGTASWRCSGSKRPGDGVPAGAGRRARHGVGPGAAERRARHDLPEPLRIAIGLHVGPVILGEMGYGRATSLTAVGDTVNVAARLEALAKGLDVELATSTRLAERAAIDLGAFDERRIEIRGRRRPLRVRLVPDARALPVEIAATGRPSTPDFARLLGLGRGMGRPAP